MPPGDNDPLVAAQNQERRKKVLYVLTMPGLTTKLYRESVNRLGYYEAVDVMREAANKLADGVEELLEQRITGDLV